MGAGLAIATAKLLEVEDMRERIGLRELYRLRRAASHGQTRSGAGRRRSRPGRSAPPRPSEPGTSYV